MASHAQSASVRSDASASATKSNGSGSDPTLQAKLSRRRTKTGCLTCRQRRIKCDEERPICRNCTKSKRSCQGYNTQRVSFKHSSFGHEQPPNGGPDLGYPPGSGIEEQTAYASHPGNQQQTSALYTNHHSNLIGSDGHAALIAPDLSMYQQQAPAMTQQFRPHLGIQTQFYPRPYEPNPPGPASGAPAGYGEPRDELDRNRHSLQSSSHSTGTIVPAYQEMAPRPGNHSGHPRWRKVTASNSEHQWLHETPATTATLGADSAAYGMLSTAAPGSPPTQHEAPFIDWSSKTYLPRAELTRSIDYHSSLNSDHYQSQPQTGLWPRSVKLVTPRSAAYSQGERHGFALTDSNALFSRAATETQGDEYFDTLSDDEAEDDTLSLSSSSSERQRNLHQIMRNNNINSQDLATRHHDDFLYEGILENYRVADVANPLRNPATARVFAHFIAVTGPSLSVFERHPRNTSVLSTEEQIPFPQQGLWTYTMPVAAMQHMALLHSMLALSSLHIARLLGVADHPSRRHYAWACKRINRLLSRDTQQRRKATTIAASMLLGFYEVFAADHRKWNLHLTGSKQLFMETDFVSMARQFIQMKRERSARQRHGAPEQPEPSYMLSQDEALDQSHDVNENLISYFVGREVRYDSAEQTWSAQPQITPALELSNFEILRDLYWWYLKQDLYQSLISGCPLLLNFDLWPNCPPRAPPGRPDALYGSFDHLVLCLGRLTNFVVRDRKRKLRQIEANGGQWIPGPPPDHGQPFAPSAVPEQHLPPTQSATSTLSNGAPMAAPPMPFYGMALPPRQQVHMPASYRPVDDTPIQRPPSPELEPDLFKASMAALEEHDSIRQTLYAFKNTLGPAFEPLSSEFQAPLDTPFGPALYFRSYDIAVLWAMFYMAQIILVRAHPYMHPAAHAAAGLAARDTAELAQEIGRINAVLVPGPIEQPLNPTLGAALCESCLPAFFAAVQYTDPRQRYATVMRIYNIGRRTGYGSVEVIAQGCETAWVKAAEVGRGPPYVRQSNISAKAGDAEDGDGDKRLVNALGVLGMEDEG